VDEVAVSGESAQAKWLWGEMTHLREQWNILRHPFYRRWCAGELTDAHLQAYASEHHHTVVALASASRRAAALAEGMLAEALARQAADQEREIEWWCEFAVATGWCRSASWYYAQDPLPQTIACAQRWSGAADRPLAQHLVTLSAIEAAQCQVAPAQLDALIDRYGFCDGQSTEYFRLRAERAADNAALAQAALIGLRLTHHEHALLRHAELAHRSYWELLDGVQAVS
jgi:pyrroloquinoline quinone (PQQ) biosynthesis protein C